jgi:hypothetical protein
MFIIQCHIYVIQSLFWSTAMLLHFLNMPEQLKKNPLINVIPYNDTKPME